MKINLKNYFDEILNLNPSYAFLLGIKNEKTLKEIENPLSINYINNYNKITEKYKNTDDNDLKSMILLNNKIIKYEEYIPPLSSFENSIITFIYNNKKLYPKKYNDIREEYFDEYIESCICKLREGIHYKITLPKIICKKIIKQIEKTKYKNLYYFLKNEYLLYCRNSIGLCNIKNGKKLYKLYIKLNLGGINTTPQKIHKLGKKIFKKLEAKNDFYTNSHDLMKDANEYYEYIYNVIIPNNFHYIPTKDKCIIKPVPEELKSSNGLAYYDIIENTVFINIKNYKDISKSSLYSLIMHESFHQYMYSYFNYHKLPLFKKYGYSNEALIEGFAFYMELLSKNYNENTNEYTQLRNIRLIVDTGINYYGWTYEYSFNYMKKHLAVNDGIIKEEIERYICIPSQALIYTLGKNEILKLRNKFKGNIKDFHDFLLKDGIVSFNYLHNKLI